MINVLNAIYTELTGSTLNTATYANGRIYYGIAPQNTKANSNSQSAALFPYIVYNKISESKEHTQLNSSTSKKHIVETFTIQIDIYDNSTSAINIETMAGKLDDLFDLMSSDFSITGYKLMSKKKILGNTTKTQDNNWRHISRYELKAQRS